MDHQQAGHTPTANSTHSKLRPNLHPNQPMIAHTATQLIPRPRRLMSSFRTLPTEGVHPSIGLHPSACAGAVNPWVPVAGPLLARMGDSTLREWRARAMDSCAASLLLLLLLLAGASSGRCDAAEQSVRDFRDGAVALEREEVCVVGSSEVGARYCASLSLRDIGTGEGFLRQLSWLRIENTNLLLEGDAVGPLGTRMVLGLKSHGGDGAIDVLFNDTSFGRTVRADVGAANLFRMELLLKEIMGGEAIGWSSAGPLGLDRDARVITSPFKTMVVLGGGAGLGVELEALVPGSFRGCVPDISSGGGQSDISASGLWHWLPASTFDGLEKHDGWPSFFSSLGVPPSDPKPGTRGRFLPKWLAERASVWDKELSSSQWQVHQQSVTLVAPRGKRRSLSLTYCESARSRSPPKCTASTQADKPVEEYDIPGGSELQVKVDSTELSDCSPSRTGREEKEGHWVLQDVQRTLVGKGAHRMLESRLTLSGSGGSDHRLQDGCQLRLLERLPSGVFADQFELQGIQRRGGIKEAWIHGDKNLEQPALLSRQSIVVVDAVLRKVNSSGASVLQAEVAIPLHARYPPLSVESHSIVHVPMPHMFVSCQQEVTPLPGSRWEEVVAGNATVCRKVGGVLDWMVPGGNPADYSVVARFTAISALTGVLVVLGASVSVERGM